MKSVNMTSKQVRNLVKLCAENAKERENALCNAFCELKPEKAEEKENESNHVIFGIDTLYINILRELERIEKF